MRVDPELPFTGHGPPLVSRLARGAAAA